MCLAEVLGMVAFAAYSANLPGFIREWGLSNTEAGWIGGVFSLGNILAIPILVSLTDRIDARTVYLGSTAVMGLAYLGFGLLADGFWTALLFRGLSGAGFGGTLIPGLRLLSDLLEGPAQTRAITLYSACGAVGGATSFLIAGLTLPALSWRWVFLFGAAGCLLAALLVLLAVPRTARKGGGPGTALLDFRPVIRNRPALAYILCNFGHTLENYGARGWTVAFLTFALAAQGAPDPGVPTPILMSAIVIVGFFGNYMGGALAARLGRRRAVLAIVTASLLAATAAGASAALPFAFVMALVMLHSVTMTLDNAVLNAGAIAAAAPALRGATMAVYGLFGFVGAMLGPTLFGLVLDLVGSGSVLGWTAAFASLGLAGFLGAIALLAGPEEPKAAPERAGP